MSVEYTHHLIPTRPLQRPSAERIASFIAAMRSDGWLSPQPPRGPGHSFASDVDAGRLPPRLTATWLRDRRSRLRITWSLDASSRYPLDHGPENDGGDRWTLELHWSRHFLPTAAEELDAYGLRCACGEPLHRRPPVLTASVPFRQWVCTRCPTCGARFDPEGASQTYVDPWTGAMRRLAGMGLHRFALQIDCGAAIPAVSARQPLRVHPELVGLATRHLATTFHDDIGALL